MGCGRQRSDRGAVVVQFMLLLPLLLSILLLVLQVGLIAQAKLVVNYAAFAAARSAVVVIPSAVRSSLTGLEEGPNEIAGGERSAKLAIIRRAAALACAAISPPRSAELAAAVGEDEAVLGRAQLEAVALLFSGGSSSAGQYADRAWYAFAGDNTTIDVDVESHPGAGTGGTSYSLVTVTVTYRYFLAAPFADRLLGTQFEGAALWGGPYYLPIVERYTLTSEDDLVFPDPSLGDLFEDEDVS
ncbi:MAG: hypothetical protein GC160_04410 [Acidobacteria bacterium]|nr:hypothetical protein [Acidobacteriota bacterium]